MIQRWMADWVMIRADRKEEHHIATLLAGLRPILMHIVYEALNLSSIGQSDAYNPQTPNFLPSSFRDLPLSSWSLLHQSPSESLP